MVLVSNRDLPFGFYRHDDSRLSKYGPTDLNSYELINSWGWLYPENSSFRHRRPYKLLFVHGFNTSLRDAIFNGIRVEHLYGADCVCFSWPSRLARWYSLPTVYSISKRDVRTSAMSLARIIVKMVEAMTEEKLILAAHSMGNLILRHVIDQIPQERIERIVMIAADLPQDIHRDQFSDLSNNVDIHIIQNKSDYALRASSLINGCISPSRLGQVAKEKIQNATYHDLSGAVRMSHSYHIDKNASTNKSIHALFEALLR